MALPYGYVQTLGDDSVVPPASICTADIPAVIYDQYLTTTEVSITRITGGYVFVCVFGCVCACGYLCVSCMVCVCVCVRVDICVCAWSVPVRVYIACVVPVCV